MDPFSQIPCLLRECLGICIGNRFGSTYCNGFQVLGTHDTAHSGSSAGSTHIVCNTCKFDKILSARSDTANAKIRIIQFFGYLDGGLLTSEAPEMACITELHLVIVDIHPSRVFGLSFDDNLVITGILHGRSECTTHIGIAVAMNIRSHDRACHRGYCSSRCTTGKR